MALTHCGLNSRRECFSNFPNHLERPSVGYDLSPEIQSIAKWIIAKLRTVKSLFKGTNTCYGRSSYQR